ncbi:hypothetical protein [Gordonia soli]|uniref:Transmembrane protein n=1 Tax=Gordonia soli NBRC 108243 TaxID=1223545 RepID=M0QH57_9ACTN|nr:hypothetical protein [Gordonia soli]GAC67960.1 hypothetical protein GS4_11_02290 [Gordonia soli NBRC 108243]
MHELEAIGRVLLVGLIFGAGLPALFAVGLRTYALGQGDADADGTTHAQNPALKAAGWVLFFLIAAIIVVAVLWIARASINYHLHINLFPFAPTK